MDFIERWFGISPDGGNGTFELSLVFVTALAVVALACVPKLLGALRGWRQGSVRTRA
jgi:hypothetical protein